MDISIIIPIYNESEIIKDLCNELISELYKIEKKYEIIFIDDGSTDDSKKIILSYQKKFKFIKLIEFIKNYGQNNAIFAGFKNCSGELVFTMDGDMQVSFNNFFCLLDNMDNDHDIISGYRSNREEHIYRKICSKIFNFLINRLLNSNIKDFGSMFRIHKKNVIDSIIICNENFLYTSVITTSSGFSVKEIPVSVKPRKKGNSKYDIFSLINIFLNLIIRYAKNIFLYIFIFNILFFIICLSLTISNENIYIKTNLIILEIIIFVLSIIFFLIGEYILKIYLEKQFNLNYKIREELYLN